MNAPWNGYINVAEVETIIANLATKYPALARMVVLPETSFEGRQCRALWLGSGPAADKDVMMVIGGVHGLEWGSCEIALNFAIDLLGSASEGVPLQYGSKTFEAEDVQALLNGLHIVVFPLVNPDGRYHSQHVNSIWRKNRNLRKAAPGVGGVDLNRNFDFLFDFQAAFAPGSGYSGSSDPLSDFYCGPLAFSESESRNVRWLLDEFERTRWFVDLHACAARSVMYSWGDDESQDQLAAMRFDNHGFDGQRGLPGDEYAEYVPSADVTSFDALASAAANTINQITSGTAFDSKPSFRLYPTFGTSQDYAYSRHMVNPSRTPTLGFTLEWGTDPHPDWSAMESIMKEVSAGLIAMCQAAAAGA